MVDLFPNCLFSVGSWPSTVTSGLARTPAASVRAVIQMDFMANLYLKVCLQGRIGQQAWEAEGGL